MWTCRKCGRRFANRNQTHTCRALGSVDAHFAGKGPAIRALYDAFLTAVQESGDVNVLPEKTRIAFQVRMSFAQVTPRKKWLDGHLVLARRVEDPRFTRIETFSSRNHLHAFRLERLEQLDSRFRRLLAEAYRVGAQEHLKDR